MNMSESSGPRLILNAVSNYAQTLLSTVVFFFFTPYMIRMVGSEHFALWSLVFSVLGFFGLMDFGFATSVVKYVAEARGSGDLDRRNRILSTIAVVYALVSLVATLAIILLSLWFDGLFRIPAREHGTAMALLWILGVRTVTLGLPLAMFRGILFGEQRISLINGLQAVAVLAYALLGWWVLAHGYGVVGLAWVNLLCLFVDHGWFVWSAFRLTPQLRITPRLADRRLLKEITGFSASQLIINVAGLILLRTDPIIVQLTLGLQSVALYAIALRLSETMFLLSKQMVNVLSPYVAELKGQGDEARIREVLLRASRFALAIPLLLAVVIWCLGDLLLTAWVGPAFRAAASVLAVLSAAMTLAMLQEVASIVLSMTGRHRITAKAAALGAVVNVISSVALALWLGLIGVALGTLVTAVCVNVGVTIRLACRCYAVRLRDYLRLVVLPPVTPALCQAAVTLMIRRYLHPSSMGEVLLAAIPGVLTYAAAFYRWGLRADERERIGARLRRQSR